MTEQQVKFTRAVHAVFGDWTALRLAVENEFAGSATRNRALALMQRVLDGLLASTTVHRDELEDLLDLALIDDFNIEAEDDSPKQVAEVLCMLHAEASRGVSATADMLLERAAGKSSWVQVPPPPRVRGDDDSSDEDIDDGAEGDHEGREPVSMDAEGTSSQRLPEVDEDGFQMVQGKGRRR